MQSLEERDYFSDHSILKDPYAYFEAIRAKGPVYQLPKSGIVVVTGFNEALEVLNDTEHFSSVIAAQGPGKPLPFEPQGSDLTPQIEAHRAQILGGDLLAAYDDSQHSRSRALLSRLFTPSRLKANEQFIGEYSDQLVTDAVARGGCDLVKEIATPFVTLVIADLLGVPADDRQLFMDAIDSGPPAGSLGGEVIDEATQALMLMGMYFAEYVHDRRKEPQQDILSELSNATYPDGATPDAMEIVRLATFLFAAGQDTSAKLLGNSMKYIVDEPGLQDRLRKDPSLIPALLEEVLRLEGSIKMTGRLARKDASIAGLKVPIGTKIMVALSAANRDERRWDAPRSLILDRPKIREHIAFGRGAHVCPGAPLARTEVRIILEKFLAQTSKIDLDETKHGAPGRRDFDYDASFLIRGLSGLHLKLAPAAGKAVRKPERKGFFGFGSGTQTKEAAPTRYSTAETKIGVLLADPVAKAIIDKYFPGVTSDKRIGMARTMKIRGIAKFAPELFKPELLDEADKELAALSPK